MELNFHYFLRENDQCIIYDRHVIVKGTGNQRGLEGGVKGAGIMEAWSPAVSTGLYLIISQIRQSLALLPSGLLQHSQMSPRLLKLLFQVQKIARS